MIISRLILKNWRNFREIDVPLRSVMYVVGPNASGKSNLLDVLRFLRDIAKSGGGLQHAIELRGGLSKIRCLAARKEPNVEIEIHLAESENESPSWKYGIGIAQEPRGHRRPRLTFEKVWKGGRLLVSRPDKEDERDSERLTQTHLEQIQANEKFRDVSRFLDSIRYLHLVPQLLRYPSLFVTAAKVEDPFGRNFLDALARTPEKVRNGRLKKIETALRKAVPLMKELVLVKDKSSGEPHLQVRYEHWRPNAGIQQEDQFSDGTLRLIGLFWSLLDGDSALLLEEPELSLHSNIVEKLPSLIARLQRFRGRQVILTTHSSELLRDPGIGGEQVLELKPDAEGTSVQTLFSDRGVRDLLASGMPVGDIVTTRTKPPQVDEMSLFP